LSDTALMSLDGWRKALNGPLQPVLRIWQVKDAGQLADEKECRSMAEAIHRIVLAASFRTGEGRLLLSLAGGRKTMSSDIQNAAGLFGCSALLHVIDRPELLRKMREEYSSFSYLEPLPEALGDVFTPIITGRYDPAPFMLGDSEEDEGIVPDSFPVEMPEAFGSCVFSLNGNTGLITALNERRRKAASLLINYERNLRDSDHRASFMALYSLPKEMVARLKETRIGQDKAKKKKELALLQRFPKTELHCHLGGVLDIRGVIETAGASRHLVEEMRIRVPDLESWLASWQRLVDEGNWKAIRDRVDFKAMRRAVEEVPEPLCVAAFILLFENCPDLLERVIYGEMVDEKLYCGIGFNSYERMGDIQGSGLLQNEPCIRAAVRYLIRRATEENVRYLELRCSPVNYTRGTLTDEEVTGIITQELCRPRGIRTSLIFIASRHGEIEILRRHIALTGKLLYGGSDEFQILQGFDLAGNEKAGDPELLRQEFMPILEKCMHLTIHAGEIVDASSIWKAVYHLNAERIGHGLTLIERPELMEKFRDRNITLEMCPSSNFQIIGFRDNYYPNTTSGRDEYPLKKYLDAGLRITVNTDNPGISRTGFTQELHRAARLTPGGLSLWEILILIRNGFKAAFTNREERHRLIREAETEILTILNKGIGFDYHHRPTFS